MPQAHDLSLEGKVAAVAADPGQHFSKPVQDRIVLVEGHGVKVTPMPALSSGIAISPAAGHAYPISGRST